MGSQVSNLRKGQLNRHTRYRPATLPHETLPRSGRVARWTNTPARIFKDPHPAPTPTSQSVPPTPPTALRRPLRPLRKGQLNRHTLEKGSVESTHKVQYCTVSTSLQPQPLPHETLPRSGRVARWTNTPARIFKYRVSRPRYTGTVHLSAPGR